MTRDPSRSIRTFGVLRYGLKALGICLGILLSATLSFSQQLSIIRNTEITSLSPLTPAMGTLFDPNTGSLLGQLLPQEHSFALYSEALVEPSDGPLVLYQLDDSDHTLFVSLTPDNKVLLTSLQGRCRTAVGQEVTAYLNTIPSLQVESLHASQLFGIGAPMAAVVCEDDLGVLSLVTAPELLPNSREVALSFMREAAAVPAAFIRVVHDHMYDAFNRDGGFRYDRTDPANPGYLPLDANGNPISESMIVTQSMLTAATCLDAAIQYRSCLAGNQEWLDATLDYATESIAANVPGDPAWDCIAGNLPSAHGGKDPVQRAYALLQSDLDCLTVGAGFIALLWGPL